jgi:hypothetical protein
VRLGLISLLHLVSARLGGKSLVGLCGGVEVLLPETSLCALKIARIGRSHDGGAHAVTISNLVLRLPLGLRVTNVPDARRHYDGNPEEAVKLLLLAPG